MYRSPWLSLPPEKDFVQACEKTFLAVPLQDRQYDPVWCYLLLPLLVVLEGRHVAEAFQVILHKLQGKSASNDGSFRAES